MYADEKVVILDAFRLSWKASPRLTVSQWADENRILSTLASSESGQWRTERTPYLKEIMDHLSVVHPCQEVVFMKGSQVGGTEAGNNWIGYIIDHVPAPVMIVQPNLETAKRNSNTRIAPLLEECPSLSQKVPSGKSREKGNTATQKEFPGGILVMTGANSAVGLRSMPVRFLFLDEVDGYPSNLDGEGDPVSLAEARTRTFSRRKIFKVSTPTIDGESKIQKEFENSDQRYYFVPCPHCKEKQKLIFKQLKWDGSDPKTVRYYCEHCGEGIEEHHKTWMLEQGEWIAENPDSDVPGFHLSALYSPLGWFSWSEIVKDFLKSQGDREAMKAFVNTVLGECYYEKGDAPEWRRLYQRRENFDIGKVSDDAMFLTMAVDVQKNRLEWEVKGWGRKKENWSIDFGIIEGATNQSEVWNELEKQIGITYPRSDGTVLPIRITAIDSGYETQTVYNFVRRFHPRRVVAVKGREELQTVISPPRSVDIKESGKVIKRGAVMLWSYGSSIIKSEIYGWLNAEPEEEQIKPVGYSHFPMYDEEYFKQLTAEQIQRTKTPRGYFKYQWVKKRDRNEALDLFVMNRAAAAIVGIDRFEEKDWKKMEVRSSIVKPLKKEQNKENPTTPRRRKKGSFWQ